MPKYFNFKLVPFVILSFPLFVDILNGVMKGSHGGGDSIIGVIFRGAIVIYSLRHLSSYRYKRLLFCILLSGIVSFLFHFLLGGFSGRDISAFFKMIYGFFVLAILLGHNDCRNEKTVCDCSIFYAVGAGVSLIICGVFGIGYSTYHEGTFGTKGFFIAMNDISLTMLMLNALSLYCYTMTGEKRYFVFSILIAGGSAFVGSISAYIGTIIIYCAYAWCLFFMKSKDFKSTIKQKAFIIVVIVFASLYIVRTLFSVIMEDAYLSIKYADLASVFIDNSGRSFLIEAGMSFLSQRSLFEDLWGSGDLYGKTISLKAGYDIGYKGAESDFFDIYGAYGMVLVLLLYLLPVSVLLKASKDCLKTHSLLSYWVGIISLIFIGHSYYGGHALTSPLSYGYYMIVIYLLERRKKSKKYYKIDY